MGAGEVTHLEHALKYAEFGFPVFPLHPGKKSPFGALVPNGKLNATVDADTITRWWTKEPNAGIGAATNPDGWFFVFDVDVKDGIDGRVWLKEMELHNGPLPNTLQQVSGRGSGSRHYFFRTPLRKKVQHSLSEIGDGIDILSNGYVVLAPTLHEATMQPYHWDGAEKLRQDDILYPPEWLVKLIETKSVIDKARFSIGDVKEGSRNKKLRRMYMSLLGQNHDDEFAGWCVREYNRRIESPLDDQEMALITRRWFPNGDLRAPGGIMKEMRAYCKEIDTQPLSELYKPNPEYKKMMRNSPMNEKPYKILMNAVVALRYGPHWNSSFAYDEFSKKVYAVKDMCSGQIKAGSEVKDADIDVLTVSIQNLESLDTAQEIVGSAVGIVARDNASHPVKNYLDSVTWDGEERIEYWLQSYCGAPDSAYTRAIGSKWLISAVARIMEPGCKVDTCLILEGIQGDKKSWAIEALASERWFTDDLKDLSDKDTLMQIQGKWIIELGEIEKLNRHEVGVIKAFMSRKVDRFRSPYGRRMEDFPRQCVFAGTANRDDYLQDETGNRRFWPVRTGKIRLEEISADRDQLWAEAVISYRKGIAWWITDESILREAKEQQAERQETDAWDYAVQEYCDTIKDNVKFRIDRVMLNALDYKLKDITEADKRRCGRILRRLGYKPAKIREGVACLSGFVRESEQISL